MWLEIGFYKKKSENKKWFLSNLFSNERSKIWKELHKYFTKKFVVLNKKTWEYRDSALWVSFICEYDVNFLKDMWDFFYTWYLFSINFWRPDYYWKISFNEVKTVSEKFWLIPFIVWNEESINENFSVDNIINFRTDINKKMFKTFHG